MYMRPFSLEDHTRLAETLRYSPHAFALSHRHNTTIRELYAGWAEVHEIDAADMLITRPLAVTSQIPPSHLDRIPTLLKYGMTIAQVAEVYAVTVADLEGALKKS